MKIQSLTAFILLSFALNAQQIQVSQLKNDIVFLADKKLEGRGTGEKGCEMAAEYISNRFKEIGLLPKGETSSYLKAFSFKVPANPHGAIDSTAKEKLSSNVLGYIDNAAENTIVIGAHYDHLGFGHDGNSLEANSKGMIHHGADDNASGVAGVLALASYYQNNKIKERYNFLFVCFSGEELGLFGSKKFCDQATIDLKKVHFMLNMDMIGRLDSAKRLVIYGVGTAAPFVEMITALKQDFLVKLDSSGIGPSDHTSFYLKDIPVLHFFTGQHGDYHKPSDVWEKVNFEGEKDVLDFIVRLVNEFNKSEKFIFTKTRNADSESSPKFKVTLGIMPDYVFEGQGVRADGVSDGKPAAKAGMQKGDVILKLGSNEVKDMQTYMQALAKFKKGDSTTVEVERGKEKLQLSVTF
jgi:hypothetical protein